MWIPGICPYKFLYMWLDLDLGDAGMEKMLGWIYWLPNPLLPFLMFRVALPGHHDTLNIEAQPLKFSIATTK